MGNTGSGWRRHRTASFDRDVILTTVNDGQTRSEYYIEEVIFVQGDAADSVLYITVRQAL